MPAGLPPGRERRRLIVGCWRDGLEIGPPAREGDTFRSQDVRGAVARGESWRAGQRRSVRSSIPCKDVANRLVIRVTVTEPSAKITRKPLFCRSLELFRI